MRIAPALLANTLFFLTLLSTTFRAGGLTEMTWTRETLHTFPAASFAQISSTATEDAKDPDPLAGASWIAPPADRGPLDQAEWIWTSDPLRARPKAAATLLREFTIPPDWMEAASATLYLVADNEAEACLNGVRLGRCDSWAAPVALDASKALRPGSNQLRIEARNGSGTRSNLAGVLLALDLRNPAGASWRVVSDASWPGAVSAGRNGVRPWGFVRAWTEDGLPIARREFAMPKGFRRATLRVVGLGDYALSVNGQRISGPCAAQSWTKYDKTLLYREFDVSSLLQAGDNCLGLMFGSSFWHNPFPPAGRYNKQSLNNEASEPHLLRLALTIEGPGQSTTRIVTDDKWRCGRGPVIFSHVYAGEDVDDRLSRPGWDRPGFDATIWEPMRVVKAPPAELAPQRYPAFAEFQRFEPERIAEPAPGVFLYAFPQNMSARLRLEIDGGRPGQVVRIRCGEHRNADDRLFGKYVVSSRFISAGRPATYEWAFFYLGMQYLEIEGAVPEGHANPDGLPVVRRAELIHVRAALPETGAFRCSSTLYNRTHELIDWAVRSNMGHVMTDCPHREKLGWLECSYLLAPTFLYRYDGREWFAKIARDIRDSQRESGFVQTVAPSYPAYRPKSPYNWTLEWGAAVVMVPWTHYTWFGDTSVLRDNYAAMDRFMAFVASLAEDGLAPGGLGDWYDYGHGARPGPSRFTDPRLTATATWAICARAMAGAAEALGRADDAVRYHEMHDRIARDFRRHFYDAASRTCRNKGSPQCANAIALCADLVPAGDRPVLVQGIIDDLERRDWQQTPGDVGHVYFIRALAEAGRSDILHRVYSREGGQGGYGAILARGMTAMPETWDALMDGSNSLNHCMLGHIIEWHYSHVLGIRQPAGGIGWNEILIAPEPGGLTSAEGRVETPLGTVSSRWRVDNGKFRLECEIPSRVAARAILPSGAEKTLSAGRNVIEE